ncbi:MAG TPA: ABC transporter permease [Phycisphaerales bacterium]|nr:ABC transporter permease [Phycisphaerales bacterium]
MLFVALRMLTFDTAKYLGLIFTVAFSTFLISQQASVFASLMTRTTSQIRDVSDASVWVAHPEHRYIDEIKPMSQSALTDVRGVEGVKWAVRLYRGLSRAKAGDGTFRTCITMGVDDATLVGLPRKMVLGESESLRLPDAVFLDRFGYSYFFPGQEFRLGGELELNDRRARVAGIIDSSAPFVTFPVIYTRYSLALTYAGQERNTLSLILAQPEEGVTADQLAARIRGRTGLTAMSAESFGWQTIWFYIKNTGIPVNFGVIIVVGILVGTVVAAQTLYLFTLDNLKQYAALKAIGVKNSVLAGMVLVQSSVVGAIGYGFGAAMCVSFFFFTRDMPHLRGFITHYEILGGTALLMALIVIGASALSLQRVVWLEPATVFR